MGWLENSISKQRSFIEGLLIDPLSHVADICANNWDDRKLVDQGLKNFLQHKPDHRCRLLYVIDKQGLQYSSNISADIVDDSIIGQDLSNRPYLENLDTGDNTALMLSDVYIDKKTRKPCITALHGDRTGHRQ